MPSLQKVNVEREKLRTIALTQAAQNLFREQGGVRILRPSEDLDGFHFTDYLDPAAYKEIAAYLTAHRKSGADFWEKAASDSMKLYAETLNDTGTFPANININARSAVNIDVSTANNTNMWYDGIRSPWRIARYITMFAETSVEAQAARDALRHGNEQGFSITHNSTMDAAMYFPLSVALGDTNATAELTGRVLGGKINANQYFENTLRLLGIVDAVFPHKVNISEPASTAAPAVAPQVPAQPPPRSASGKAPVTLSAQIRSGWNKRGMTYTVTRPNILSVQGNRQEDTDFISVAQGIARNGASELHIKVRSVSGSFPWGGKVFGVATGNDANYLTPANQSIKRDGFINGSLRAGDELTFPIGNLGNTFNLGLRLFTGGNFELEFWLE